MTDVPATRTAPPRRGAVRRLLTGPVFWLSAGWIVLIVVASAAAPLVAPYDPLAQDIAGSFALPTPEHLLGTDSLGRDLLSRLIAGANVGVFGAATAVLTALVLGIPLGLLAGYVGGAADAIVERITDALFAIPGIMLLLAVVALFGRDTTLAMITLGILFSASFTRLVRNGARATRQELYVDAARVSGLGAARIMARHVLPNLASTLLVQSSLALGAALEMQAGLSFLGLGPADPEPSWGGMVAEASRYIIGHPWLMVPPGAAIILSVLAFNFLGDAIRDATSGRVGSALPKHFPLFARVVRPPRSTAVVAATEDGAAPRDPEPPGEAILEISGLEIAAGDRPLVHGVSLTVRRGRTLGLVGESGSGKTLTALAVVQLLVQGLRITAGSIRLGGEELLGMPEQLLGAIRGRRIGLVSQEPMSALDPNFTVRHQLREPLRNNAGLRGRASAARAHELLALVGIPDPERVLKRYPHELSGGMAQRVAIAIALTGDPELLIADEPTTALDVTVQAEILDLLRDLQRRLGMGILLVTHDFGVVADICDDVVVMESGRIVEAAPAPELFAAPAHAYTRELLAAAPENWSIPADGATIDDGRRLLRVSDLTVDFRSGWGPAFRALDGVSLDIRHGETVGLVGESGSGKSTIGRALLGLVRPTAGRLELDGVDLTTPGAAARRERSRAIQAVFQDPYGSLNPRLTIGQILAEPLLVHGLGDRAEALRRIRETLDAVRLPADAIDRYPREFSGGQRQRVAIARAFVMRPRLIVADEALSALDLSTQLRVAELMRELQEETGVSYLFIGHDLSVVRAISSRVVVLFRGSVVERGTAAIIGEEPREDYTRRLLLSAPVPDPVRQVERRATRRAITEQAPITEQASITKQASITEQV